MKLKYNRFAIIPVRCTKCHRYIWLEKYRRVDIYLFWLDRYWIGKKCSDCIKEYDVRCEK